MKMLKVDDKNASEGLVVQIDLPLFEDLFDSNNNSIDLYVNLKVQNKILLNLGSFLLVLKDLLNHKIGL